MRLSEIRRVLRRYNITLIDITMANGEIVLGPHNFTPLNHYKCGPNHNKWLTLLIPDKVYFNRSSACSVHDHMYTYPVEAGEDYRQAADALFRINMDSTAKQQSITRYGKYLATPFNFLFEWFVINFGRDSFYRDK